MLLCDMKNIAASNNNKIKVLNTTRLAYTVETKLIMC